MSKVVELSQVSVQRGKTNVVDALDLEIPRGIILGLLGPSGAGKSTVMRAIVGVQAKVKGRVSVLGHEAGSDQLTTLVSYDTQASSVFADLTVEQNLNFARKILGIAKSRVAAVLQEVGLAKQAKQRVSSLSGGQLSRVSLAVALIGDPEVIILDEPTVGLDPVLRADLWAIFRKLADAGKTLIVSSHVMDEAERCDRIVFIRDGKVIANDSLANILLSTDTATAETAFLKLARSAK